MSGWSAGSRRRRPTRALFLHERLQRKAGFAAQKIGVRQYFGIAVAGAGARGRRRTPGGIAQRVLSEEQALSLQDAKQQMLDAMEATLGHPLDLEGLDEIDSPEELLASLMRKVQDERQAEEDRQPSAKPSAQRPPSSARPKSRRRTPRPLCAPSARQLASALHPDRREPDLAERERKRADEPGQRSL